MTTTMMMRMRNTGFDEALLTCLHCMLGAETEGFDGHARDAFELCYFGGEMASKTSNCSTVQAKVFFSEGSINSYNARCASRLGEGEGAGGLCLDSLGLC